MIRSTDCILASAKRGFIFIKPAVSLFVITFFCTFCLGITHFFTSDFIAEHTNRTKMSAMNAIFLGAEFSPCEFLPSSMLSSVYAAYEKQQFVGWCMECSVQGFSDRIGLLVGVNPECEIIKVNIISCSETPGLGSKVQQQDFLAQFYNRSAPFEFSSAENEINRISGATISSNAVRDALNAAVQCAKGLCGEGEAE